MILRRALEKTPYQIKARCSPSKVGSPARKHQLATAGPSQHALAQVALLIEPDLLLRLRAGLEGLLRPTRGPSVLQVLDHELNPLAVDQLAVRTLGALDGLQSMKDLLDHRLTVRQGLQCEADGHQELHGALQGELMGHLTPAAITEHQLSAHGSDHLGGKQLAQEEVSEKLHVGAHTVLTLPSHVGRRVGIAERLRLQCCVELLEQFLEQRNFEADRPVLHAPFACRELRKGGLQVDNQVCVGLAVVGLGQSLVENELDDDVEFVGTTELHFRDFLGNRVDVLRTDLVQQALNAASEIIFLARRRHARHTPQQRRRRGRRQRGAAAGEELAGRLGRRRCRRRCGLTAPELLGVSVALQHRRVRLLGVLASIAGNKLGLAILGCHRRRTPITKGKGIQALADEGCGPCKCCVSKSEEVLAGFCVAAAVVRGDRLLVQLLL
mmetsp:Transcript_42099/g.136236  ORF Transcript_42099/g.136236 Transcript_42099/m.136236 type:complete len:440 (+) Transcript_42099:68-1387(+)